MGPGGGDFETGVGAGDVLSLSFGTAFDSYGEVMAAAAQVGGNVVITIDATTTLILQNTTLGNLAVDDFIFA